MAAVYGLLGLVVILTAGTFGTINSSPWFNLAIAALFIALGLAMFDVIDIDLSRFSSGMKNPTRRGTFGLAFFMGAVAALLAGACVAPVVIQVVLFSSSLYAGGTPLALALPFVLGIGMAIPWPIAGAGLAALPKPGAWMVRVKQAFGVLILGTAVYYGYLSYSLFSNLWVDSAAVSGSVQEKLEKGWTNSLAAGLERAEREAKPVLIDFWATWCKPCLRELPHIERLFQAYRSQGLQVIAIAEDETRSLPKVKSYIKTHGFTFPVLLDPNQRVLRDFRGTNCPYLVVISPTGEVVYLHSGYRDGDEKELAEVIARVIASHGQSAVGASDSKAGDPQPSGED
jgi:thiol:disulfide interchange protein